MFVFILFVNTVVKNVTLLLITSHTKACRPVIYENPRTKLVASCETSPGRMLLNSRHILLTDYVGSCIILSGIDGKQLGRPFVFNRPVFLMSIIPGWNDICPGIICQIYYETIESIREEIKISWVFILCAWDEIN